MATAKIRLCVDHPLGPGQSVPLNRDAAHYLFAVMRLKVAAPVLLFNGRDGEFLAEVTVAAKRNGVLVCKSRTRVLQMPPDLWFLFAPVKKDRTSLIVQKVTELGAARIMPVQTEFSQNTRMRHDRLQAQATEAAEQCGATFVPPVDELRNLGDVLHDWPEDRQLFFCDETLAGTRGNNFPKQVPGACAILIGPEGGFSVVERNRLQQMPGASAISLGPRILRADTAAVAALSLWQTALGDW